MSRFDLSEIRVRFVRREATLLAHDGSEFPGGTIVKELHVPYKKNFPEVVDYADNSRGFSELGKPQGRIDSMVVECLRWAAVKRIKGAIADDRTKGLFRLEVPNESGRRGGTGRYLIRFFDAPFPPQTTRRGPVQLFRAQISDIEVLKGLR